MFGKIPIKILICVSIILCSLLIFILSSYVSRAQKILEWEAGHSGPLFSTLKGEFTRITTSASETDTVMGTFWFFDRHCITLLIHHPIQQRMMIDGKTTFIYYPDKERGFRLLSETPVLIPIVPGLAAALEPDGGLGDLGYEMDGYESRGDTTFSYWNHPGMPDESSNCILAHIGQRLVEIHLDIPKKQHETVIQLSQFVPLQNTHFPTSIYSRSIDGTSITSEWVYLEALELNPVVPDTIKQFDIPPDVEIIEKEW